MNAPTVWVVTPVYNGDQYIAECIESVLTQDYRHIEYTILNNCSTDRTLDIARRYATKSKRVEVRTNRVFVSAIENHNAAFRSVPRHCKYCKVVSADDWLMPSCVSRLVEVAEAYPSVGIVGSYQRSGDAVKWQGLPRTVNVLPGRDAARLGLLEGLHVLGAPTSTLYRTDLLTRDGAFFPHGRSHADTSACYKAFQYCDFGFVHEELSVERVHQGQWSAEMDAFKASWVAYLELLCEFGPLYLSAAELAIRRQKAFNDYYQMLGACLIKRKGREFWAFHRSRLREIGYQLDWSRIGVGACEKAVVEGRHPLRAFQKLLRVLKSSEV